MKTRAAVVMESASRSAPLTRQALLAVFRAWRFGAALDVMSDRIHGRDLLAKESLGDAGRRRPRPR
jgi:hypothetical protein